MDHERAVQQLGISSKRVQRKAQELDRLMSVRQPQGLVGKMAACRTVACLELASRLYQQPFDRAEAVRVCGATSATYLATLSHLQVVLDLRPRLTVGEACIRLGCLALAYDAQALLDAHACHETALSQPIERPHLDFSPPIYAAAAVLCAARVHKVKIKQADLLALCCAPSAEFALLVKRMTPLALALSSSSSSTPSSSSSSPSSSSSSRHPS